MNSNPSLVTATKIQVTEPVDTDERIIALKNEILLLWVELTASNMQLNRARQAIQNLKQVEQIDSVWGEDFCHELDKMLETTAELLRAVAAAERAYATATAHKESVKKQERQARQAKAE